MKFFQIVVLLVLGSVVASGQTKDKTTMLSGTVYDDNGAVVPEAVLIVQGSDKIEQRAETNSDGFYQIVLKPDNYYIQVNRPGFKTFKIETYRVGQFYDSRLALDIVLEANDKTEEGLVAGIDNPVELNAPKVMTEVQSPEIKSRPLVKIANEGAKETTHFCGTVRDELGATVPYVSFRFKPTKQSQSRTKYNLKTDSDGQLDVMVMDGVYDIEVRAESFKRIVLKKQLLPYDPRGCRTITLKTAIPQQSVY